MRLTQQEAEGLASYLKVKYDLWHKAAAVRNGWPVMDEFLQTSVASDATAGFKVKIVIKNNLTPELLADASENIRAAAKAYCEEHILPQKPSAKIASGEVEALVKSFDISAKR